MRTPTIDGQLVNDPTQMGLASIPDQINHFVGIGPVVFTKPLPTDPGRDGRKVSYLILHVEQENFRLKVGDATANIGAFAIPAVNITDGSGSFLLEEGEIYVFTAPDQFTIVGETPNSVMTYCWV